jgi:enterochelin esterase family protein
VHRHGPLITEHDVLFRLPDRDDHYQAVRLHQELARPRVGPDLRRVPGAACWELRWRRHGVDRMEYQFQVAERARGTSFILDPGNPLRAAGAFGEKSVIEFPGYRPPAWLAAPNGLRGSLVRLEIECPGLGVTVPAHVWSPDAVPEDRPLPLLLVHDGTDYARYADLLRLLAYAVHAGRLPPHRAALLVPVLRNEHYAASGAYARALVEHVLPALEEAVPVPPGERMRVGMGASLGALAMLHAQRTAVAPLGALFLQSGSYFRRRTDAQEAHLVRFARIDRFVRQLLTDRTDAVRPVPVTLTCGAVEENLANNQAVAAALAAQGHRAVLHLSRDAHNWVAWRDVLDPHLLTLLGACWS